MLKDQTYQATMQEVRNYPVNPIITAISPKNTTVQNNFPIGATPINYSYSHQSNPLNPEANIIKPVSVPVYSTLQSPKQISFANSRIGVGGFIGPVNTSAGFENQAMQVQNIESGTNTIEINKRFSTGGKIIPTRPNYHFFGAGSRQQISRSNSPPVHIRNPNQNSQSRSYSPLSIRSNSSEANKNLHRVKFSYNYGTASANVNLHPQNIQPSGAHTYVQTVIPIQQNQPQVYPAHINQQSYTYSFSQPQPQPHHQQQYIVYHQAPAPQSPQNHLQFDIRNQHHQFNHNPQHIYQHHIQVQHEQQNNNNQYNLQNQVQVQNQNQQIQEQGQIQGQGNHQGQVQFQQGMGHPLNNQIVHINSTVVHTTTVVWEHRFVEIYTKFQIFVQRFQTIIEEIYGIDDMFDNVNDEEAWNDLRLRYSDMIQNFNIMREEIIMVLEQNKAAINSLSPEVVRQINQKNMLAQQQKNEGQQGQQGEQRQQRYQQNIEQGDQTGKSGSQNNHVWQNRCLQLMQQHQILTKQNNELKQIIEQLKSEEIEEGQNQPNKQMQTDGSKIAELQKNLNLVHSQYQKLEDNYNRISVQYSRVLSELQNRAVSKSSESANQQIAEMQQQLEMAQGKINELYEQLQEKTQHVQHYEKQMEGYAQVFEQNKKLIETLNKNYSDLDSYQNQIKNRDQAIQEYNAEINRLNERISQMNKGQQQQNKPVSNSVQLNAKIREIQSLKQHEKSLLNLIEKHEMSIEQMVRKNQKSNIEFEAAIKQKQNQIKLLERFLQEQRESKKKLMSESYENENRPVENMIDSRVFKERVQIQIEQAVNEKNRKIRHLTQDLEELKYQVQSLEKEKQKEIKQIKLFFTQEEEKYIRKISQKQASIKMLQEKTKTFQSELSNKNMEISRFRHQSPVNSFSGGNEESRRQNEMVDKKNHEIQQLKRTIEQKNISMKQLEQKNNSLQQQIHSKVFEINSLKRQVNDQHGNRAEVDNLNNVIKKKNQQINELRLSGIQLEQLKINVDSLERQKIRLNEYLKEKTRECESRDSTIQSLERKVSSMTVSLQNYGISKKVSPDGPSSSVIVNYQNLLKQRQSQIKSLKYQVQMLQTKVSISEKSIRDLNTKVSNYQKSSALLKAQLQNKVSRYESQLKSLQKQIKSLKQNKQELKNIVESLESKRSILQKSLEERNNVFEKEISRGKQKIASFEQINTNLIVQQELQKSQLERFAKESKQYQNKIKGLEAKIKEKNGVISELKAGIEVKQAQDVKVYQDQINKLNNQLKFSQVRVKNLEQQVFTLNKKIEHAESEKRSYRQRLITQHNSPPRPEVYDINRAPNSDYEATNMQILEMERFKLKDPEANDVFERKVIYELKKQNDLLRRELSNAGPSTYSVNKYDNNEIHRLSYQQQFYTERENQRQLKQQDQYNSEIVVFYKNKNKQLENRIDELLRVNNELKSKLSSTSPNSSHMSIQFYKDQTAKLEQQVASLQAKIKQMLNDHKSVVDEASGHQQQIQSLKQALSEVNYKMSELKNTIRNWQDKVTELENIKAISYAEIERLKQSVDKGKGDKEEMSKKDKAMGQLNRKNKSLEQQSSRLNNKINLQVAQMERLSQQIKWMKKQGQNRDRLGSQESQKLKRRVLELERQLQLMKSEGEAKMQNSVQVRYKMQKLRSYIQEIECLVGEISVGDERGREVVSQVRHQIGQSLTTIAMIQI